MAKSELFLSTPSARRATVMSMPSCIEIGNFYPRPPRGGRRVQTFSPSPFWISIHALREEGDSYQRAGRIAMIISIHALREEGDPSSTLLLWRVPYFYPRPPRGGRLWAWQPKKAASLFLSTPSARRATSTAQSSKLRLHISIHALREEGDSKNGEKHLRFCFIIKRSAQIWKSFSKNIRKNSCNLHRTA